MILRIILMLNVMGSHHCALIGARARDVIRQCVVVHTHRHVPAIITGSASAL